MTEEEYTAYEKGYPTALGEAVKLDGTEIIGPFGISDKPSECIANLMRKCTELPQPDTIVVGAGTHSPESHRLMLLAWTQLLDRIEKESDAGE